LFCSAQKVVQERSQEKKEMERGEEKDINLSYDTVDDIIFKSRKEYK
jgi:hypothetical protein